MSYTDPDNEGELMEWEAERGDLYEGDARVCPYHPHVKTSSPDGMFDAPCSECEMAMNDESSVFGDPNPDTLPPDDDPNHGEPPVTIDDDDLPF